MFNPFVLYQQRKYLLGEQVKIQEWKKDVAMKNDEKTEGNSLQNELQKYSERKKIIISQLFRKKKFC